MEEGKALKTEHGAKCGLILALLLSVPLQLDNLVCQGQSWREEGGLEVQSLSATHLSARVQGKRGWSLHLQFKFVSLRVTSDKIQSITPIPNKSAVDVAAPLLRTGWVDAQGGHSLARCTCCSVVPE